MTKAIAEAVKHSLELPSTNLTLMNATQEYYRRRKKTKALIGIGQKVSKSLHVMEASGEELGRYLAHMKVKLEPTKRFDREVIEHFRNLLYAFGADEEEVETAFSAVYNEELRKRLTVERVFSNLPIAIRAVNDLVSATIEGTISGSNPVNWKKVRVGLTSVVIGLPIVLLSAVYDTPYGPVGLALGAAMAGSGFQTINDGLA